jgi:hypothetical protein
VLSLRGAVRTVPLNILSIIGCRAVQGVPQRNEEANADVTCCKLATNLYV